jgi:hypothetical protein
MPGVTRTLDRRDGRDVGMGVVARRRLLSVHAEQHDAAGGVANVHGRAHVAIDFADRVIHVLRPGDAGVSWRRVLRSMI